MNITSRYLSKFIIKDLNKKIVLLSGPRQVGKTTLSKSLPFKESIYLNFDEIHKMNKWKSWIKGFYDTKGVNPRLLLTGSARMDIFRKENDSLAGRHFLFRLHPLSVAELHKSCEAEVVLQGIMDRGGFPEPYFSNSEMDAARWRKSHLDTILRQDLLDLQQVRNLTGIETLVELLSQRVGSTISFSNLARDLQVTTQTVLRWVEILESLFVIFIIRPYSKKLNRSLLKEPKIYFFDTGRVENDPAKRFENVIASALLKRLHFLEDTQGVKANLFYLRDREKREVDFLTVLNHKPEWMIEAKLSDEKPSPNLNYFTDKIKVDHAFQIVKNLHIESSSQKIKICNAAKWLSNLEA